MSTKRLSEHHLQNIQSLLWDVRFKWHNIGLALGIDPSTLEVVKRSNLHVVDDCFSQMLLKWLRRGDCVPCWKALAEALRSPTVGVQVIEESTSKLLSLVIESNCMILFQTICS